MMFTTPANASEPYRLEDGPLTISIFLTCEYLYDLIQANRYNVLLQVPRQLISWCNPDSTPAIANRYQDH